MKERTKRMIITKRVVIGAFPEDADSAFKDKKRMYLGEVHDLPIDIAEKAEEDHWAEPVKAEIITEAEPGTVEEASPETIEETQPKSRSKKK